MREEFQIYYQSKMNETKIAKIWNKTLFFTSVVIGDSRCREVSD